MATPTPAAASAAAPEVESWVDIVRQKVGAMRFGSVQIIVHEGRVTQVESTEKTRLPHEIGSSTGPVPVATGSSSRR